MTGDNKAGGSENLNNTEQGLNLQSKASEDKNREFFAKFVNEYQISIEKLDSYIYIKEHLNKALAGIEHLCDIGNGGVFDYTTDNIPQITAIDLFLNEENNPFKERNITFIQGSALDIPIQGGDFDGVLMAMLLHHLTGNTVADNKSNLVRSLREACRILKPGGRCIVVESCLPSSVYFLESLLYPTISWLISKTLTHPPTFQYSKNEIASAMENIFGNCSVQAIERGKWQMFLGHKMPTIILPTFPTIFISSKI